MHPMTETKQTLKTLAAQIRELKPTRKADKRNGRELWQIEVDLYSLRHKYRHLHIAYCLVRGRTYEEIEKPGEFNSPNTYEIEKLQKDLQTRVDAANVEWKARRNDRILSIEQEAAVAQGKLYVLVRKDLSPIQQAVQAGHAVAEYLLKYPMTSWDNGTLVYLGIRDERELDKWERKLQRMDVSTAVFIEPDIGDQRTALAAASANGIFKNLRLLDFS